MMGDDPSKMAGGWDEYALQYNRACDITPQDDLPAGSHIVHLKGSDMKADQSIGRAIRIGDFLFK